MTEAEARAIFLLAGIEVKSLHELPNKYWPKNEHYAQIRADSPWWLANTPMGLIEIGWRKRVINIDWSQTEQRVIVTPDNVTKNEEMVHAYSYDKAVRYLRDLRLWSEGKRNLVGS